MEEVYLPLSTMLQTPIHGHGEGELWGLAVHPAALSFVTASEDKTVRLWDLSTKVDYLLKVAILMQECVYNRSCLFTE